MQNLYEGNVIPMDTNSIKNEYQYFRSNGITLFQTIEGHDLYLMLKSALGNIEEYIDILNDINVFPVPDGDTGLNMFQTMEAIVARIERLTTIDHAGEIISAASEGAFIGSMGNSGIILAEFFHGLEITWKDYEVIDMELFVRGLKEATKLAYLAVSNPREGTILTIIKAIAEIADNLHTSVDDFDDLLLIIFSKAEEKLLETYQLLPEAHSAGVVDAGAFGFVLILEGIVKSLIDQYDSGGVLNFTIKDTLCPFLNTDIDCTVAPEYEIHFKIGKLLVPLEVIRDELSSLGNCLLILNDNNKTTFKVHIHCQDPEEVISSIMDYVDSLEILSILLLHEQFSEFQERLQQKS
jgi:dihydroxyacetone kinase-like predicted kinase